VLSVNALPGVIYQWDLPALWAGTSESDTLFFVPAAEPGVVSVAGINSCGMGKEVTIDIEVEDVPERPSILTEKVPPCANTVQDFYVTPTPGTQYLWEVEDDWKILGDADRDTLTVEVGAAESFLFLTVVNQCGEKEGSRLFLTSPMPEPANLINYDGGMGLPELEVTNMHRFESIQWYRNGEAILGENGTSSPLVVNMNGLYGAESISKEGCRNPGSESDFIKIDSDKLAFRAYRIDESIIIIENTTLQTVDYRVVTVSGQVMIAGQAEPGYNEIPFLGSGIFLLRFSGSNVDQKYKVLF
jgi:hypothetical protein